MKEGDLGFSVAVFSVTATLAILLLFARRFLGFFGKGELGGPTIPRYGSGVVLICLWFTYIILSSLNAYGYITNQTENVK